MADRFDIPVTVLTGFLGSGKTTVLNGLLRSPGMRDSAVIVNEFGEIGLDDVLIERAGSDAVLLANGCICCSVRDDLTRTLQDLALRAVAGDVPRFHRVLIETTGLADPGPIVHILMRDPLVTSHYRLGGILATVDAVNGWDTLERHPEAVHQAAIADRLVLTKTDLAADTAALLARLSQLNPGARLVPVVGGKVDPIPLFDTGLFNPETRRLDLEGWLNSERYAARDHGHGSGRPHAHHDHSHDDEHEHGNDHGVHSFCFVREKPVPWDAFSRWLEAVSAHRGRDLLRVKGIISIAEQPESPVVIHAVQHVVHPPVMLPAWPSEDRRTRIVFITRNIDEAAIESTLATFEAENWSADDE